MQLLGFQGMARQYPRAQPPSAVQSKFGELFAGYDLSSATRAQSSEFPSAPNLLPHIVGHEFGKLDELQYVHVCNDYYYYSNFSSTWHKFIFHRKQLCVAAKTLPMTDLHSIKTTPSTVCGTLRADSFTEDISSNQNMQTSGIVWFN